jgi:glycosyltransferase involved in cell wall biosynthesis
MAEPLRTSIIIPTCNRRDKLLSLLQALQAQTVPPESFEVIVADDGSRDGTGEAVTALLPRFPRLSYLPGDNRGQSAARNRGLDAARFEIIGFIDDDCLPEPEWIANALRHFDDPAVGGVPGATSCDVREISALTMQVRNRDDGNYETCNIFYRREALNRAGPFDPALRYYREDTDLAWRVLDAGFAVPFAADVQVNHPPHRYRLGQLLGKRLRFRWAYTDRYLERKHPVRFKTLKLFGVFTPALAAYYPFYGSLALFLAGVLGGACPFGIVASAALLLVSYTAVCIVYLNEAARGIKLQLLLRRRREFLLFLSAWWLIMLSELFFHLWGSIRFRKFSL